MQQLRRKKLNLEHGKGIGGHGLWQRESVIMCVPERVRNVKMKCE